MKANKAGASSPQRESKDASNRGQYTPSPPPVRHANGSRSDVRSGLRRALSRQASDDRPPSAALSRYSILPAIGSAATSRGPPQPTEHEPPAPSLSSSSLGSDSARGATAAKERPPMHGKPAGSAALDGSRALEASYGQPAVRVREVGGLGLVKPAFGGDSPVDSRAVPGLDRERAVLSASAPGTRAAAGSGGATSLPGGGSGAAVRLAVKLPDGRKVEHAFDPSTTLQRVLEHVAASASCDLTNFALVAWGAAPKTSFRDNGLSIAEAGIQDRTLLYLEPP